MKDLGYLPPKPKKSDTGATPVTIVSDEDAERKPQYPCLRLNGEQAETAGLEECHYDQEYEVTFRIRAKRIGGDSWERTKDDKPGVEFDVISSDEPREVESSKEDGSEKKDEKPKRKPRQREVGPDEDFKSEYKEME
jgi:hypothetical protein